MGCSFQEWNSEIEDKLRAGRPPSATTQANTTRIDEIIRNDRRVTVLDIIQTIGIGSHAVQNIITELGYRKVCARWVPRQLTDELKQTLLNGCIQLLQRYQSEGNAFTESIITGDESRVHHYEPKTKRQSMQ